VQLKKQVDEITALTVGHIRTYELNENARESRRVQDALYDLELWEAANGTNTLSQNRKRDLQAELQRLGRERQCIIRNDPDEDCSAII
jgi:hypothetical protein